MLKRFSLYGFLKNQRYDEPFLILALLQMGLSYTWIGVLIGVRELTVNLVEIPSGAIADVWGRRKSMMLSFVSYIMYFILMGSAGFAALNGYLSFPMLIVILFIAMFFFAVGDAFRTGTHKAMIFTWLRIQGRINEKTVIYGYTRSWSKIGSAVSVILAGCFVFFSKNYLYIFFFSIIPYIFNLINFAGYPKELDGEQAGNLSVKKLLEHLKGTFLDVLRRRSLRRLILESMGFEGFFKSVKDYLQPLLKAAAIPLAALLFSGVTFSKVQESVILVAPVYFVLFVLSAFASRNSHLLVHHTGNEEAASRRVWIYLLFLMILLVPAMYFKIYWLVIVGYLVFYVLENLWRPVLISRFDAYSSEAEGATVLSIESQAKSLSIVILAPLLGMLVDWAKKQHLGQTEFWPLAVVGMGLALIFVLTAKKEA